MTVKTACNRCGACCRQGGPALHCEDLALVESGSLHYSDLITVRRGELAMQPMVEAPQPVAEEFVKIQAQGRDWCCKFYDHEAAGCTIYGHRPVACGLLDCTRPDALLAVAGRDLLSRFDLLASDDPLLPLFKLHEEHCPCPDSASLQILNSAELQAEIEQLTRLVHLDLRIRTRASKEFDLSVARELFYFGRPLFQLLQMIGFTVTETMQGIQLHHAGARK